MTWCTTACVVVAVPVGVAVAVATAGVWLWRRGSHCDSDDDALTLRAAVSTRALATAFLECPWVVYDGCDVCKDAEDSVQVREDVVRAMIVYAKSRGVVLSFEQAGRALVCAGASYDAALRFDCPTTDVFDNFLHAECMLGQDGRCTVEDFRAAFRMFARERGLVVGKRALSLKRLDATLSRKGLRLCREIGVIEGIAAISTWM